MIFSVNTKKKIKDELFFQYIVHCLEKLKDEMKCGVSLYAYDACPCEEGGDATIGCLGNEDGDDCDDWADDDDNDEDDPRFGPSIFDLNP